MREILNTRHLVDALILEGFPLPDNCREARVVFGPNNAFIIQYDVYLTEDDLVTLGRAFQRMGETVKVK